MAVVQIFADYFGYYAARNDVQGAGEGSSGAGGDGRMNKAIIAGAAVETDAAEASCESELPDQAAV